MSGTLRTGMELLPPYYRASPEMIAFQAAFDREAAAAWAAREDFLAQLNVETASWGLALWERELGLKAGARSAAERRSRIKARIRAVAQSFAPEAAVRVAEHCRTYTFELIFDGVEREPNFSDLGAALDEVKPAHLAFRCTLITRPFETGAAVCGRSWAVSRTALPPMEVTG